MKINRSFIRPHLDYGHIIHDKPNHYLFKKKIKSVQYKACIALTVAIQGTSCERLYQGLGLESLEGRCLYQELTFFIKLKIYLFQSTLPII